MTMMTKKGNYLSNVRSKGRVIHQWYKESITFNYMRNIKLVNEEAMGKHVIPASEINEKRWIGGEGVIAVVTQTLQW